MNIFEIKKIPSEEELTDILVKNDNVRIERIISAGQITGWYDQQESELVILVEGSAAIEYENGKIVEMRRGDTLMIHPHEKHRVCYTSNDPLCVWLCIFFSR